MNETVRVPYIETAALELTKAHADDAAFDLRAAEDGLVPVMQRKLIPSGIAVAIPEGYAGLILSRSGLALKHGVIVANAPGLIDPGYRGDVGIILFNLSHTKFHYNAGDRLAQILFIKTADVALSHTAWLPHSQRADAGFGSTGMS